MALLLRVNVEDKSEHRAGLGINLIFLASIRGISFEGEKEKWLLWGNINRMQKKKIIKDEEQNGSLTETSKM